MEMKNNKEDVTDKQSELLEKCLVELAGCEKEMDEAEKDAEIYRIRKTQEIYAKRRSILRNIPKFWYIVLAENDDFSEYLGIDDLKYLEAINDIYVHYNVADSDDISHYRDYSITLSFKDNELIQDQTITKEFKTSIEEGEEKLYLEPVDVNWPKELDSINPRLIKEQTKAGELSKEQKKQYRLGMKSFFAWFAWTGKKPGKEFRNGEDVARLITDDLFPYAVKYYTEAMPGIGEEDSFEDSSEGEELDISDDEPPKKKRAQNSQAGLLTDH